jgi:dihydrofolate synthase/folylpolyglutamate synthase
MTGATRLPSDLEGWLEHIGALHPAVMELGLSRVQAVLAAMHMPARCPVIVVGGTNGKGSTCAMLEAILLAAGYRVGTCMSPHLVRYNERVRINGREAGDEALCAGFAAVEHVRGDVPLTYFEFATLATWATFQAEPLDAIVLEIGLGGRLDAVNAFEPDVSIVTSVALDHVDVLGDTREKIGWEKAHVYRAGRPALCGDPEPPASLVEHARSIGADLWLAGRDFGHDGDAQQWRYRGRRTVRGGLAYPALRGTNQLLNASVVLAAFEALGDRLPVTAAAVREGFAAVTLPGRFQVLPGRPVVILDVAHNPHAAAVLAANLASMERSGRTIAVFGMLRDKDMAGVIQHLHPAIDIWHVASLPGPRGAEAASLERLLVERGAEVHVHATVEAAWAAARESANEADRIVATGSFLTVGAVLQSQRAA